MTLRDLIDLSIVNLWRIKLRAFLTTAGVTIAIATFVAMLSFAAGNQRYFTTAYHQFGLFTNINVYPKNDREDSDSTKAIVLDNAAIEQISQIPGVDLAYPYNSFNVTASVADTQITTTARALTTDALKVKLFTSLLGGATFSSDSAREAIVTHDFMERVGVETPDSLIGEFLVISADVSSMDSALVHVLGSRNRELWSRLRSIRLDSLSDTGYRTTIIEREINENMRRFFDGLMNRKATIRDTLLIVGVGAHYPSYRFRMSPIVVSRETARRFTSSGLILDDNPAELITAIQKGTLFNPEDAADTKNFSRVTLELDPVASHKAVIDSVEALGFRAFSYADQFKNLQRFMLYYYIGLGIIGVIALVTAALGIVNTLVMSITERRREIGVLKSLGADEREIRVLFLVESAVIGAVGSVIGIVCGWAATRVVSLIIKTIMEREEMPVFEPFALPYWLVLLAIAFGIAVSVLAGLYPASRAARVDPVEALRSE